MLTPTERRCCDLLGALGALHIAGGLLLPFVVLGTPWLDAALALAGAQKFWVAILGPTIASWGALQLFLVHYGLRRRQRWAADALIVGVLVWAPLDGLLCAAYGVGLGVAVDLVMAPLLLLPALWLRRRYT